MPPPDGAPNPQAARSFCAILRAFTDLPHRMLPHWLIVVILGVVEGLTEFLPVSSTGHLLIAEHLLKTRETDLFNVVIQAGAVLAVIPLFRDRFAGLFMGLRQPAMRDYWLKLFAAFAITGAGGLVMEKLHFKLPEAVLPVGLALVIGGVLFLVIEWWLRGKELSDEVTWTVVIAVGLGQLLAAMFPGASRSGTTILLALALGLSRPAATEFTFIVGIPTLLAASGLKIFKALRHPVPGVVPEDWTAVAIAFVVAAIVSFIVVKWMLGYIRTHTFVAFGWYRIVVGLGVLFFLR